MQDILEIRKQIHQNPELGNQEFQTQKLIIDELKSIGLEPNKIADTGIYAFLDTGNEKTVLLRADMDALPILENTGLDFQSKNKGKMHACGHDIHMSVLLETANKLVKNKEKLKYNIVFAFQPAEELSGGAQRMIDAGILEMFNVKMALAYHVWPAIDCGYIGIKDDSMTATCDEWFVEFSGTGGHVASSKTIINPVSLIGSFEDEITKIETKEDKVIVICNVNSGTGANNIIPTNLKMSGTARVFNNDDRISWQKQMRNIVQGLGKIYKLDTSFSAIVHKEYPPVINDKSVNDIAKKSIEKFAKIEVFQEPYLIAEDFSCFHEAGIESSMLMLGCNPKGYKNNGLHQPDFMADEKCIEIGANILVDILSHS